MRFIADIPSYVYSALVAAFLTYFLTGLSRGRRIKDEFAEAILEALKSLAERPDQMDFDAFHAYKKSVKLLTPYAEYFRINNQWWWRFRVEKAWKNYAEPKEGAAYSELVAAHATPKTWSGALILLLAAVRKW
jgi:hypothetical protein